MNRSTCVLVAVLFALSIPSARGQNPLKRSPNDSLYKLLDGDQDGNLDPYEAMDVLLQLESEFEGETMTENRISNFLKGIENDEQEEVAEMLSDMDANKDGKTTLEELDKEMRGFAEILDQNQDGIIAVSEARQANIEDQMFMNSSDIIAEVDHVFGEFDKNKDGQLTKDEVDEEEISWNEMSESDSNRDACVTKTEMIEFITSDNQRAEFKIVDSVAVMTGVICADTPARMLRLVHEHPSVRTIEMRNVPGSIDDAANLRAARYVRHFGFATTLKSHGRVASGGTDFFLAGRTRTFEKGAMFGIHSWAGPGFQGKDVPRDDPQHQLYLKYYEEMGTAADFYWRTLEAAPANDIHWMTEKELKEYKFRTAAPASQSDSEEILETADENAESKTNLIDVDEQALHDEPDSTHLLFGESIRSL